MDVHSAKSILSGNVPTSISTGHSPSEIEQAKARGRRGEEAEKGNTAPSQGVAYARRAIWNYAERAQETLRGAKT